MLTFPERVLVRIGNYIIRKIPLKRIEGAQKSEDITIRKYGEAIVEMFSLVHIRNVTILNRNLCILELEFLTHYTLNHLLEIPSIPRNTKVTFVNQSAVKLTWQLPEVTGYYTDVYYDVECRNTCNDNDEVNCDETACRGQVSYLPSKQGLHETHVLITHLSSFVTYEFRIYARNRVSGVAQKMHGIVGNFALYRVTTNASSESVCFLFSISW